MSDLENEVDTEVLELSDELPEEAADIDVLADDASGEEAIEVSDADFVLDHEQIVSIVESALYVNDRPMTVGQIKSYFKGTPVRSSDIRKALKTLAQDLSGKSRGVQLVEIESGFQLRTKLENAQFLRGQIKPRVFRLSQAALEALAIVAYKQPCTKAMVDEVRGVESGHLLRALLERGLLDFAGKSDLPGKPMYYGTTKKFMEIFGLKNLEELPSMGEIDQLLPEGIDELEAEEQKKESLADLTARMSEGALATYSQGEEELEKISTLIGEIDTSSEFFEQEKAKMRARRDAERAQNIREALEVGEQVPEKEIKWLAKHDAQVAEAAAAPVEAREEGQADALELALSSDVEVLETETDLLAATNMADASEQSEAEPTPEVTEEPTNEREFEAEV